MMTLGWRDYILKHFVQGIARLTIVADPDGLLNETTIQTTIRERGFTLLVLDDRMHFRYAYERNFRMVWDENESAADLILVIEAGSEALDVLSYDLLERGRQLFFSLADLFPALSYPVVKSLDVHDFDRLYSVYPKYQGLPADGETADFILRHVYGVDVSNLQTVPDLMQYLLIRHYNERYYPDLLDEYLLIKLTQNNVLSKLPIDGIVSSRRNFIEFLAKAWLRYLLNIGCIRDDRLVAERNAELGIDIPFESPAIRNILDNYFTEGLLAPVAGVNAESVPSWARVGVASDTPVARREQILKRIDALRTHVGEARDRQDWLAIGKLYGETQQFLLSLAVQERYDLAGSWSDTVVLVDGYFTNWLKQKFAGLVHVPYLPQPAMVHHIPHYLSAKYAGAKVALIVVDGMNYTQWHQVRGHIAGDSSIQFDEHAVFAWVPTVTSVSRQALFAGESPFYFADDIHTTAKDGSRWKKFWQERKVSSAHIMYQSGLGKSTVELEIATFVKRDTKVVGLVINTIDDIVHGVTQGYSGVTAELGVWLEKNYLVKLLELLWAKGFTTYLTSDHGNIEAMGSGRPAEGILAETKGERMRIYKDQQLLQSGIVASRGWEWSNVGLPPDNYVLLANDQDAFVNKGEMIMAHGGVSLSEVIVPFVKIWRKSRE